MRIIDSKWTEEVNLLLLACPCGAQFWHRADRWKPRCPAGHAGDLGDIRTRYVLENRPNLEYRLPKLTASWHIHLEQRVISEQSQVLDLTTLPRNVMDELQQIVGNGLARVAISADMGIKDYGTGAGALATVSLTCNQDMKTLERAAELAGELARGFAQEQRQRAENELQSIIAQRAQATGSGPRY